MLGRRATPPDPRKGFGQGKHLCEGHTCQETTGWLIIKVRQSNPGFSMLLFSSLLTESTFTPSQNSAVFASVSRLMSVCNWARCWTSLALVNDTTGLLPPFTELRFA